VSGRKEGKHVGNQDSQTRRLVQNFFKRVDDGLSPVEPRRAYNGS
jgi:hypothetical protein